MDNTPVTVTLKNPITVGQDQVTQLVIRPATAKHMRRMPLDSSKATMGLMMDILAELCDCPPSTIDKLGVDDLTAALEVVGDFLAPSQQTSTAA